MRRVIIFGNSGSGKSTLAKKLVEKEKLAHLDLDTLAWLQTDSLERRPLIESKRRVDEFILANNSWVIEGCYIDLIALAASEANEAVFMNLNVDQCVENAKNRPWEPHKYESKETQDSNLTMLINWIRQYVERSDEFSFSSHMNFYKNFAGKKSMYTSNDENN